MNSNLHGTESELRETNMMDSAVSIQVEYHTVMCYEDFGKSEFN